MELFKKTPNLNFMAQRVWAFWLSGILVAVSALLLGFKGLNLGLDFTGGVQLTANCASEPNYANLRAYLASLKVVASVQRVSAEGQLVIRAKMPKGMEASELAAKVVKQLPAKSRIEQVARIGGQASKQMLLDGFIAAIIALIGTIIYVAVRFEWHFGLAAAIALFHDPMIILGVFSVTGLEFDLIALVAVLTIIGYSLNDTIVIYDRARENFFKYPRLDADAVLNLSVNQTLSRTIMLSGTTLAVVVSMLVLGGALLKGFSVALLVGIIVGTYSSVYIAGSLALTLGLSRAALTSRADNWFTRPSSRGQDY